MDFYFCQTSYPQERERFLEEVFERATVDVLDAFRAGESTSLNHLDYVEKLSSEEISKICKVRALWRLTKVFSEFWRGASMEEGLQTLLAGAPSSLHQRIHWFWSFCQDGTAGDTPPTEVYDQLGGFDVLTDVVHYKNQIKRCILCQREGRCYVHLARGSKKKKKLESRWSNCGKERAPLFSFARCVTAQVHTVAARLLR